MADVRKQVGLSGKARAMDPVVPILSTAVFAVGLTMLMGMWVHHAYQGNWWGPFLPSWTFGIPAVESAHGLEALDVEGWDGQFSYYVSNDLLGRFDAPQHIDMPSYRYQRIGLPLLAAGAARLLGYDYTPPEIYHGVHLALMALGAGMLVSWLRQHKVAGAWTLGWILGAGTLHAFMHGLPDPAADALLLIAMITAWRGQLAFYLPAAIMLPLVREAFLSVIAMIWLLSCMGHICWGDKNADTPSPNGLHRLVDRATWLGPKLRAWVTQCIGRHAVSAPTILLLSLPGVITVAWQVYMKLHFGILPAREAYMMVDAPLVGIYQMLSRNLTHEWTLELPIFLFGVFTFVVGFVVVLRRCRQHVLFCALVPYFAVLTCVSKVAWAAYPFYLKVLGAVFAALVLALPWGSGKVARAILVLSMATGLANLARHKPFVIRVPYTHPATAAVAAPPQLKSYASVIAPLSADPASWGATPYHGFFKPWHRSIVRIGVTVTNAGPEVWRHGPTDHSIALGYQLLTSTGETLSIDGYQTELDQDVPPGSSMSQGLWLIVPPAGSYLLRLSLKQGRDAWFCDELEGAVYTVPMVVEDGGTLRSS